MTYDGLYSVGQETELGRNLDLKPASMKITPHLQVVVDQYNRPTSPDGCGYKDWVVNMPKEISGRYCRPFQIPKVGSEILEIISIEKDELRFGRNPPLVGRPERPSSLSEVTYKKVH